VKICEIGEQVFRVKRFEKMANTDGPEAVSVTLMKLTNKISKWSVLDENEVNSNRHVSNELASTATFKKIF
jgi:hypothetical protein